jgi:hypothetical protein
MLTFPLGCHVCDVLKKARDGQADEGAILKEATGHQELLSQMAE